MFSKDYEGLPHAHETWGAFWVLQGRLRVTDWAADRVHEPSHRVSQTILSAGSGGCFSPPVSDWHEVRVEEPCDQVISIHVYGKGFNLDRGLYRNAEGQVVRGPRGPLKMWRDLAGSFC